MDIEDIAKIDLFLKLKNGTQNILDIDDLIIADNDSQAIQKLKESAYRLNEIDTSYSPEELFLTWQNLFTKQVRYSVNRTKIKKKK
jgi:hypothetical protein